jgi:DNA polymerase
MDRGHEGRRESELLLDRLDTQASGLSAQRFREPAEGVLHLDFETCCEASLKSVGADVYSRHPSLVVTVCAWAIDDGPMQSVTCPETLPPEIEKHLLAGGRFSAWNAAFESAIIQNHFGLKLKSDQPICCQQRALHSGLPAALDDAGPAIGSVVLKDTTAHRLMLQLSRPRKNRNRLNSFWHVDEPAKLEALRRYCEGDVGAERGISKLIIALPPTEARISELDRAANERGVRIDLKLVAAFKALAKTEIATLNDECAELTNNVVSSPGTQTARLMAWFEARGVEIPSLSKQSVGDALETMDELDLSGWADPTSKRVLEIRQEVAKSSLKKLEAMERCAGPGDRVRHQLSYYGASRTGRFAGRLVQPQNFPRPSIKMIDSFITHVLGPEGPDAEWVRLAYGRPLDAIASSLKGCLIPGVGKAFVVYDLSQIEARVVAWLAGQTDILDVFARGEDVYVHAAAKIGSANRQLGKVVTLACSYQMGPDRFRATAAGPPYNLSLTALEAETAVRSWREANPKIVDFWWTSDRTVKDLLAAFTGFTISAPINDKVSVTVSRARNGQALLTMLLPSGRRLYYRRARLVPNPAGGRDEIVYSGVDPITKRWGDVRTYGGKIVENATQSAARDCIIEAALRIDDLGLGDLVLSVHDELVFEVPIDEAEARSKAIGVEIDRRPPWALDLPVASAGGVLTRYGK